MKQGEPLRLLKFAIRWQSWHHYGKERKIVRAIRRLYNLDLIVVDMERRRWKLKTWDASDDLPLR